MTPNQCKMLMWSYNSETKFRCRFLVVYSIQTYWLLFCGTHTPSLFQLAYEWTCGVQLAYLAHVVLLKPTHVLVLSLPFFADHGPQQLSMWTWHLCRPSPNSPTTPSFPTPHKGVIVPIVIVCVCVCVCMRIHEGERFLKENYIQYLALCLAHSTP